MLTALALAATCASYPTAPAAAAGPSALPDPPAPTAPLGLRLLQLPVTVEVDRRVHFRNQFNGSRNQQRHPAMKWEATGGTIESGGTLFASRGGTSKVIARAFSRDRQPRPDTSVVMVVPRQPAIEWVRQTPSEPRGPGLAPRTTYQFAALGRTSQADSIAVRVIFQASGGAITESGLFTAGETPGTFGVVASARELADTAVVTLASSFRGETPAPVPDPAAPSRPTPPPSPTPPAPGDTGIPMGIFGLLSERVDPGAFTMAVDGYTAGNIVSRIGQARRMKIHLFLNMTGGAHSNYMTGGVFDMAKWRARMDTYNTPTIRAAIADAVADGTIIGNSVMDEPANVSRTNSWGPRGTMTKARVDEMCRYVKDIFPTLPVGVLHNHRIFEPETGYQHCEFLVSQYRLSKGDVRGFGDSGVAWARRHNMSILFSLNILHGGDPGTDCEKWGDDPRGILCPMTGNQLRDLGITLGSAGCALLMWKYEEDYIRKPEVQSALRDIADHLAKLPRRPCTRS